MRLRPDLAVPWPALAAFGAFVYVVRSVLRGWDFRPTVEDGLVFGGLALLLVIRALVARSIRNEDDH